MIRFKFEFISIIFLVLIRSGAYSDSTSLSSTSLFSVDSTNENNLMIDNNLIYGLANNLESSENNQMHRQIYLLTMDFDYLEHFV